MQNLWLNLTTFIINLEFNIKLPDDVRAFFFLSATNFFEENDILARTTHKKLSYANIKVTILKIYGDLAIEDEGGASTIKQEPLFQTEHSINIP